MLAFETFQKNVQVVCIVELRSICHALPGLQPFPNEIIITIRQIRHRPRHTIVVRQCPLRLKQNPRKIIFILIIR